MKNFTLLFLSFFISFSALAQVTFNWERQSISPGNNLQGMNIVNDTTTILVGYGATFVKSANLGITWDNVPILDPLYDFTDLSINNNGIGYACTGDQKVINNPSGGEPDVYAQGVLLKTTDHGVNWSVFDISKIGEGDDPALSPNAPACYAIHFYSVEVVDDNTALIGIAWYEYEVSTGTQITHKGVFKTIDGGDSWIAITDNGRYPMAIEHADSSIYFGGSNHLLKTVTGSDLVTDIYPNLTAAAGDATVFVYDFAIVNENEIYVITSTNGAYKTLDRGATFIKLDGTGAPTGGNDIYSVNDSVLVILGGSTKSKVSTDYGATWVSCYPVPEPDPKPVFWEIGGVYNDTLYGLAKSNVWKIAVTDLINGTYTTWVDQVLTDGISLQKMHIFDASRALIIGNDETFMTTDDAGISWTNFDLPELFIYGAQYDFSDVSSTSTGVSYASTRRFLQIELADANFYGHGLIYRSTDYWGTWELLDESNIGDPLSTDPSLNPYHDDGCYGLSPTELECINDTVVYVYANWADTIAGAANRIEHSRVYKTTDGGDTWTPITDDFGGRYVNSIYFIDDDTGFIVGNQILLKTIDAGDSFTDIYTALTAADPDDDDEFYLNEIHYIDENEWYLSSISDGVFATLDGGATYTKFTGISGTNGVYKVDASIYIVLGNSSRSKISWDAGVTWTDCYPGSTIWGIGGVLNDSLVGLAKTYLYKIALTDLAGTGTDILSFVLDEQTGDAVINTDDHTITIEVETDTDVSSLTPTIAISSGATITPGSAVAQDFTSSVTYTVTSADGATTQDWVATVSIAVSTPMIPESNVTLYPNPVRDNIYLSNLENIERIVVISVIGEKLIDIRSDINTNMEIDLSMLKGGIYFISFQDSDGNVSTKKLIKE